ncbi:aminoglycoside N(3)-acetyltransferase [Pseudalkalibacillus caeni]|uniref:Aminoglycoside N(3)-acetyltransferase n=1 Tax=Exobacillus caeni TaxID=2574798 RepID=A0A5R9F5H0_9BACL|nr:AAC(3) family N-acetyltransferase [Pseudalkalibacillus caeni]TLS38281.1 AAC(3) family N-acetyltransferase [Pseudalkalibacillus caeni]
MGKRIIEKTDMPRTRESLAEDLRKLGVKAGMTVIVHSSMQSIGWVCGGAVAVIEALMDTVTETGNIVMPTQSPDLSDPSEWENPPVPKEWWSTIRNHMPAYNPEVTPTMGMGKIPELFRNYPGVVRSDHPAVSFAAWGPKKEEILFPHPIENGLGEDSPLRRLYDMGVHVLFLGTGYGTNTSFHLGEYRAPGHKKIQKGAPVMKEGKREWVTYSEIQFEDELFEEMGRQFERQHSVLTGMIGSAPSKFFSQKEAVDFSESWFTKRNIQKN